MDKKTDADQEIEMWRRRFLQAYLEYPKPYVQEYFLSFLPEVFINNTPFQALELAEQFAKKQEIEEMGPIGRLLHKFTSFFD